LSILHVASLELVVWHKVNVPINLSSISKNSEDDRGRLEKSTYGQLVSWSCPCELTQTLIGGKDI